MLLSIILIAIVIIIILNNAHHAHKRPGMIPGSNGEQQMLKHFFKVCKPLSLKKIQLSKVVECFKKPAY